MIFCAADLPTEASDQRLAESSSTAPHQGERDVLVGRMAAPLACPAIGGEKLPEAARREQRELLGPRGRVRAQANPLGQARGHHDRTRPFRNNVVGRAARD